MTTLNIPNETNAYCLGYNMVKPDKCDNCRHFKVWEELNELRNDDRLYRQLKMKSINIDTCRLTNMGNFKPIEN